MSSAHRTRYGTLEYDLMEFFKANPGEYLTPADVETKFGDWRGDVLGTLDKAVKANKFCIRTTERGDRVIELSQETRKQLRGKLSKAPLVEPAERRNMPTKCRAGHVGLLSNLKKRNDFLIVETNANTLRQALPRHLVLKEFDMCIRITKVGDGSLITRTN